MRTPPMITSASALNKRRYLLPGLAIAGVLALTTFQLHRQGRVLWCACGQPSIWASDIRSAHNSQHVLDPYSFTHLLHGVVICGVLAVLLSRMSLVWKLAAAVSLEGLWEILENSQFVIQRYRAYTVGIGYCGDSVINSMADIACCAAGLALAAYLGWRRSAILFAAVELVLLICVRDSLILSILMLACPIEAIKTWQMAG